ncbi:MAG: hypothetical protein NW204_00275 [Xanthomonadaceae bacterium]|nr:hypothetical protein [Xanthomonadaceae bacterium]
MTAPSFADPTETASERAQALQAFIGRHSAGESAAADPNVAGLLCVLRERFGDSLAAVLIYGSYLRGKRDTVLDFVALLHDYRAMPWWQALLCRMLAPNVYHIGCMQGARSVRAKCATLSLARFEKAMTSDFHSYFWARFAQPCLLLECDSERTRERVVTALANAANTFIRRAAPVLPPRLTTHSLWTGALEQTYRCELRAENRGYANGLVDANPAYFQALTPLLSVPGLSAGATPDEWAFAASAARRRWSALCWRLRRAQGKVLSVARVAKASTMFDRSLDYILWKIERHSGIHIEPSTRQRRFPLLFAWPLLWRLYRRGAFR